MILFLSFVVSEVLRVVSNCDSNCQKNHSLSSYAHKLMPAKTVTKPRKGRIVKRLIKIDKSHPNDKNNCNKVSIQPVKDPNIANKPKITVKPPPGTKEAVCATKSKDDKPVNPPITKPPCIAQPPMITPYPMQPYPMIPQYSVPQIYPYYPQVPFYPQYPQYQPPSTPQPKPTKPKIKVTLKKITKEKKPVTRKILQKKKIRKVNHSYIEDKKDENCREEKQDCQDFNKCITNCEEECKRKDDLGEGEEDCKNVDFCKIMCHDLSEESTSKEEKSSKSENNSSEEENKCVPEKDDNCTEECKENPPEESKDSCKEKDKDKCVEDCEEGNKEKCKENCKTECQKKCENDDNNKPKEVCLEKCDDDKKKECIDDCKENCNKECNEEDDCENISDDKIEDDFINCDDENEDNSNEILNLKNTEKDDFFITNSFKYSINNGSNTKNTNDIYFKDIFSNFCKKVKHAFCHNKDIYKCCMKKSINKLCKERKNDKSEINWNNCKEKKKKIKEKAKISKYFKQCLNHELKILIKNEKEKEFENRVFDKITNIFMTLSGVNQKKKQNKPIKEYFGRSFIVNRSPDKENKCEPNDIFNENCIQDIPEKPDSFENEAVTSVKNKIISDIMKKSKEILDSNPEYTTEAKKNLFIEQIREIIKSEIKNNLVNSNDEKPMLNKIGEEILKISKIIENKKTEIGDALIENKNQNEEENTKEDTKPKEKCNVKNKEDSKNNKPIKDCKDICKEDLNEKNKTKDCKENCNEKNKEDSKNDKPVKDCKDIKENSNDKNKESKENGKNNEFMKDCKEISKDEEDKNKKPNEDSKEKPQHNKPLKHKKEKNKETEQIPEKDSSVSSSSSSEEQLKIVEKPKKKLKKPHKIPKETEKPKEIIKPLDIERPTFIPEFKIPEISLPKIQLPPFYNLITRSWTQPNYEDNLFINETPNIPSDDFVPISRFLNSPQKMPQYIPEPLKTPKPKIPSEKDLLEKYGYKEISKEGPNIVEINRNIPLEENEEKDKIKFLDSYDPKEQPINNLIEENDDKHIESDYEHNLEILKNDINNLKNSQIHKKFTPKVKNNKTLKDAYENGIYVIKNANLKPKKDNLIIFNKKDLDCINSNTKKPKEEGKKIIYLGELLHSQ